MTELEKIRRFPAPLLQSDLVTHISEEAAEQFAMGIPPEGLDQLGEHLPVCPEAIATGGA